jgi:NitT/TauT family transport system ATP-binding protein
MAIELQNVSKSFGEKQVLQSFSHTFPEGELTCVMGPSGCGKTTLLSLLLGLEQPDSGRVLGMEGRRKSAVFQEDRLCDNFSAVANIRLVTGRTLPEKVILQHLEELGLSDSVRLPVSQMSGGMRRRVAIARAVCCGPELLLLDEAFKGLDEQCRRDTAAYIRRHTAGASVLCVTHDPEEATLLGGRCIDLAALQRRD